MIVLKMVSQMGEGLLFRLRNEVRKLEKETKKANKNKVEMSSIGQLLNNQYAEINLTDEIADRNSVRSTSSKSTM